MTLTSVAPGVTAAGPEAEAPAVPPAAEGIATIVCLGDSITDGQTYSLVLQQALRTAKKPVPVCVAAGIGGDTAEGMLARLDRDVLRFRPDMVILNCGLNDISRKVTTAAFEVSVSHIAKRLREANVRLMICTLTTIRGVVYNDGDMASLGSETLTCDGANIILRRIGAQYRCPVAEVSRVMAGAPGSMNLWEADGCHLSFEGFSYMTRAILDALGYTSVRVPRSYDKFEVAPLPGVIPVWRIKPLPEGEAVPDDAAVAALRIDDSWKEHALPETNSILAARGWWWDQERRHGFAMSLKDAIAPAPRYLCAADVIVTAAGKRFINTGDGVSRVWLNGKPVPLGAYTTGWHAGGQRTPMDFTAGTNRLVAVTADHFFISVTDTDIF